MVGAVIPNLALAALTTGGYLLLRHPIGDLVHSTVVPEGILWATPGLFCFSLNKTLLGVVNGLRRMRAFAIYTSLRYLLIGAGLGLAWAFDLPAGQLPVIWSFTEGTLLLVLIVELVATVSLRRGAGWTTWARRHRTTARAACCRPSRSRSTRSSTSGWSASRCPKRPRSASTASPPSSTEGALQLSVVVQNNVNPVIARHLAAGELDRREALVRRSRRWFVPSMIGACALRARLLYPRS